MTLRNTGRIGVAIIAVGVFVVAGAAALHDVVLMVIGFVVVIVEKREDDQG